MHARTYTRMRAHTHTHTRTHINYFSLQAIRSIDRGEDPNALMIGAIITIAISVVVGVPLTAVIVVQKVYGDDIIMFYFLLCLKLTIHCACLLHHFYSKLCIQNYIIFL